MRRRNNTIYYGINFWELLTIVFIILKATGTITWSWWLVLAPIWVPIVLVILFIIIFVLYGISSR